MAQILNYVVTPYRMTDVLDAQICKAAPLPPIHVDVYVEAADAGLRMYTNTFASFVVSVRLRAAITQALLERYAAYKFQCVRMYEGSKHNKT